MAIFNRYHYFIHCWNYFITSSIINTLYFIKNSIIDISSKTPKIIFYQKKLHNNNNILALTHLLQTKKTFPKLLPNIEPMTLFDIGSFIVYN